MAIPIVDLPHHGRDLGRAREMVRAFADEVVRKAGGQYNATKKPSEYRKGKAILDAEPEDQVATVLATLGAMIGSKAAFDVQTAAIDRLTKRFPRDLHPFRESVFLETVGDPRDVKASIERVEAYLDEVGRSVDHVSKLGEPESYELGRSIADAPREEKMVLRHAVGHALARVHGTYHNLTTALDDLWDQLTRRKLPYREGDIAAMAIGLVKNLRGAHFHVASPVPLGVFEGYAESHPIPEAAIAALRKIREIMEDQHGINPQVARFLGRLARLTGDAKPLAIAPGEPWAEEALEGLKALPEGRRSAWADLLEQCGLASGSKPSAKWLRAAKELLGEVTPGDFRARVPAWFRAVDKTAPSGWNTPTEVSRARTTNELTLKGLAWCAGLLDDRDVARGLAALALAGYKTQPGTGPRAQALGNAAIVALGSMPGREGLAQLARLRTKMKNAVAKRQVVKALDGVAKRLGLPGDEVDELGVPDFGLGADGRIAVPLGDATATLELADDGSASIAWRGADGKARKNPPADVKKDHAAALKELKATARDVEAMVRVQRDRIDNLFLAARAWPLDPWRERYLDHPIVGRVARRLIWTFTTDGRAEDGIPRDGAIVGRDDRPLADLGPATTVGLWHPIGRPVDDVLAWRAMLEERSVRQPFKQAHREVYVLTDAERATRVYSNRFAAHVLRQHQFHALCGVRGWSDKLRLVYDGNDPPASLDLPQWGLRAEFWVEGAGGDFGRDTNDTGTYLYLTTDQVRFYPLETTRRDAYDAGRADVEPLPLEDIPPLVFSEVMRDVDLFVGVASVGNDPNWADGGPEGRYIDYWRRYSFGDLSATAQTRKAALERLIPRLKIAGRCSFADRFLVVRGELRTYKIHLGSGNILMEPNDQYLCIVPMRSAVAEDRLYLPFEGDGTLSVILSKALLLADDARIKDPTIVNQIRR
jgi:hypothetical protein